VGVVRNCLILAIDYTPWATGIRHCAIGLNVWLFVIPSLRHAGAGVSAEMDSEKRYTETMKPTIYYELLAASKRAAPQAVQTRQQLTTRKTAGSALTALLDKRQG